MITFNRSWHNESCEDSVKTLDSSSVFQGCKRISLKLHRNIDRDTGEYKHKESDLDHA